MKKKPLRLFMLSALFLISITISSIILLYRYDKDSFFVLIVPGAIITVAFIILFFAVRINAHKFFARLENDVNAITSEALYLYPVPVAVADDGGKIVWYNKIFDDEILGGKQAFGINLENIISADWEVLVSSKSVTVAYANRAYRLTAEYAPRAGSDFYIISLTDITEMVLLQNKYMMTRPYVLLIMIDNYDDLLLNAKEAEKAEVSVAIEHLFEEFMSQTTGILRKLGDDRFIAVIEEQHLLQIINERFKILDKARTIIIGGRTNITLSIGVGHFAKTLAESEAFAKQSLDMALGRGGDQAVVKTETSFKFFGGTSKAIEKKSRSKTRIIAKALKELIQTSRQVFIMGHCFGDFDSIGSAIGLAGAINALGRDAFVVFDFEKNLVMPLIKFFSASEGDDIFMSVPDAESSFTEDSLLIIVDTHNKDFIESKALYEAAKTVVVIDHHRKTVNFIDNAVISHHEPYASSTSEMVTELIQYFFDNIKLQPAYAEALLAGITLDTKNFVMKTGVRTFEAAAILRKIGADPITVKKMFANSLDTFHAKAQFISSTEIYERCAIVVSGIESPDIRIVAPQVADELLGIENVDASFVAYVSNNCINISARSLGAVNVQIIMEAMGGGGHMTIAAAQLYDMTIEEVKSLLYDTISEFVT